MSPASYDSAQPAGTQALRFIHEVWKRYHDNPRQSHARTQRATSFRHPPRVRATTKAQGCSNCSTKHGSAWPGGAFDPLLAAPGYTWANANLMACDTAVVGWFATSLVNASVLSPALRRVTFRNWPWPPANSFIGWTNAIVSEQARKLGPATSATLPLTSFGYQAYLKRYMSWKTLRDNANNQTTITNVS